MPSAAALIEAGDKAAEWLAHRARVRKLRADAEQDFLAFIRMMWPALEPEKPLIEGWVLDLLADVVMAAADGQLTRICVNVPPGSTKSTLLNVLAPAWLWGPCDMPWMRFLSISYSTAVPIRDNLRFSQLMRSQLYQQCWGDRFRLTRDGAEWVGNDKTGWKAVTSVTGSTTGMRGDWLLLDDLNNPADVESEVVRETTNRFVREIMPSRVNDLETSVIFNLQQRTHQHDATGTLIEHGQGYTFVCVPAEFDPLRIFPVVLRRDAEGEATDVWVDPRSLGEDGRQLPGLTTNARGEPMVTFGSAMAKAEGESFWPERFPDDELQRLKRSMTPYSFDSQFNQIPGVRGGSIIRRDWWRLWEGEYPELGTVVVSVDTAIEEHNHNDYNACTVWGAFPGDEGEPQLLLLDAWRDRMPLAQLVERVTRTCRERKADYLLIERRTRGKDVHDEIIRLYGSAGWDTVLVEPDRSKIARLKAVEHLFSGDYQKLPTGVIGPDGKAEMMDSWTGGMIFAPDREWAEMVIGEVAAFPYGAHDDLVDAVSQAINWIRKNGVVLRKVEWDEQERVRNTYRKERPVPYAIRRTAA